MRGISSKKIPDFAQKDVEIVKKGARIVFEISPDERRIETIENPNPRLNVIVIVGPSWGGPSWGFERGWEKVVLAEIGISRSRPYHEARGLNRTSSQSSIPKRRKWFSLSPHQYQLIAPIIFKRIEGLAHERVVSWEKGPFSDDVFIIPSTRRYWSRGQKTLIVRDSYRETTSGARFTVSLADEFFVRDIYWAELNLNRNLKTHIQGLVNFIDLRLNWYRYSYKGKRPFRELKGTVQVEERLEKSFLSRFPHLIVEVVQQLKEKKRNQYWPHLAEMIGWNGRDSKERKLSSLACSHPDLSDSRSRLGGIQLQVTTGLEKKKDYIVFEVFPRQK